MKCNLSAVMFLYGTEFSFVGTQYSSKCGLFAENERISISNCTVFTHYIVCPFPLASGHNFKK